ncbi:MFS general substrate transporter [Lentinus tigrinus ALCF2SS1-7]|uniref:MFS general substrate transporter n=1 Tax=Lentinus tigrinus ALCF2SS1-6 TaxID=1328759 RepID=A0A5C2SV36_9APHY|nr:MFS general substrate transporter [Lentinus tigrinus ALCF2SS1-6]RPD81254.1 MFS general substrate transporter [Lentinus tigrinus ALCF2SS1-7]
MSTMSTEDEKILERKMTRRVLWKLDMHVLPPLAFLWLANFIDRTNIGNARIAGLERDTHLHGTQFNTALAIFYVSYILVELPSNLVLKKFKPSRWLPFLVTIWGTVTTLSGLVQNFSGLLAIRFFLGFCEGGLLPGIMLYLSTLYKPHELQQRVGIFYASASLSGAFGGLLATAIIKMDGVGGLAGWRWIFILEGIATVVIALTSSIFLPADIQSAKFFTEEEREFALARLRTAFGVTTSAPLSEPSQRITNRDTDPEKGDEVKLEVQTVEQVIVNSADERFEWGEVLRGVKEPQLWMTALSYMGIIISLYSFSLFLPTIVAGLGYTGSQAQLHTVPPYVPAVVLTVVVSILSDKLKWRGPFILIFLPISMAGYILAIAAKTNTQRYAAVFLMATGIYPCGPCILSILPNNNAGHYKKATTVALQLALSNCGGFVATFAYDSTQAPTYIKGHSITLGFVCVAWIAMFCNVMYCLWENKARAEGRRQDNLTKYQELWDSGKTRAPIGDRHPDFRFTL